MKEHVPTISFSNFEGQQHGQQVGAQYGESNFPGYSDRNFVHSSQPYYAHSQHQYAEYSQYYSSHNRSWNNYTSNPNEYQNPQVWNDGSAFSGVFDQYPITFDNQDYTLDCLALPQTSHTHAVEGTTYLK